MGALWICLVKNHLIVTSNVGLSSAFEGLLLLFFTTLLLNIFHLRLRNAFILARLGNFCYQNISLESAFPNYFSLCSLIKSLLSGTVGIIFLAKSTFLGNK